MAGWARAGDVVLSALTLQIEPPRVPPVVLHGPSTSPRRRPSSGAFVWITARKRGVYPVPLQPSREGAGSQPSAPLAPAERGFFMRQQQSPSIFSLEGDAQSAFT